MNRKLVLFLLSIFTSFSVSAQVDSSANHLKMSTIFRLDGSFSQWRDAGVRQRSFSPSNSLLCTILDGDLTDNLNLFGSFRWLSPSTESLYRNTFDCGASNWLEIFLLTYTFGNNVYLSAGKDYLAVGGFEQDPSASLVYYDVASNNWNTMPVYMYGGRIGYRFGTDESQDVFLQVIESPFKEKIFSNGLIIANVGWIGTVCPGWKTMYSATMMQTDGDKDIYMISLGNSFKAGDFMMTLDIMPRAYGLKNFFGQEFTSVADIRYSFPKIDTFFKGGWEFCHNDRNMFGTNSPEASWNIEGTICPDHIRKERDYLFGSVGIEYFPLANRNLRLTLLATTNNYCNGGGAILASVRYCLDTIVF